MAHEVKATSRRYLEDISHMSVKAGHFGGDHRPNKLRPPLTPDVSGSRSRGKRLSRSSSSPLLAGRSRTIL